MPHILLIEDNPGDALLIREMYKDIGVISGDYTITHVQRVRDAVDILKSDNNIDLILSDMTLPDSEGLQTLEALSDAASELPVIFMTGTNNNAFVTAAINAGAQDYLVKGTIDSQILDRATAYSIERKRAQNNIEKVSRKAEALAQSAQLLKEQKKELIALNKAKDEFVSLSSHQLRTPATGVKQYLGMILEGMVGEVPEHLRVFLQTAYDTNERQLTIINDLLRTAQLDSGRYTLNMQKTDLCNLIVEVADELKPIAAMRSQKLLYDFTDECCTSVDPIEIKVVFANLIENASKYSPGGRNIYVSARATKRHIVASVHDEGVGIAYKDIPHVFEKFTRIDNELSDTVSGSGLGLYFVKRIVKMHKGNLQVESEPGKGSTFSVVLPRV